MAIEQLTPVTQVKTMVIPTYLRCLSIQVGLNILLSPSGLLSRVLASLLHKPSDLYTPRVAGRARVGSGRVGSGCVFAGRAGAKEAVLGLQHLAWDTHDHGSTF